MKKEEYLRHFQVEDSKWQFVGMRKIRLALLDRLSLPSSKEKRRILDVGCGTGAMLKELNKYGQAIGMDISREAIEYCRQKSSNPLVCATGEKAPFKDETFELVTAFDVIEHIFNDQEALNELSRVCKIGGYVFLFTSALSFLWSHHDVACGHFRRYNAKGLKEKIEKANLRPIKLTHVNTFLFPLVLFIRFFQKGTGLDKKIKHGDISTLPAIINKILILLLNLEGLIVRKFRFPFGVSLICLAQKI